MSFILDEDKKYIQSPQNVGVKAIEPYYNNIIGSVLGLGISAGIAYSMGYTIDDEETMAIGILGLVIPNSIIGLYNHFKKED